MRPYATTGAYNADLLHTWKAGTRDLFELIAHIMSYRNFLLLADNGQVNLKAAEKAPDGLKPLADPGPVFRHQDLMRECNQQALRGLNLKVIPELRSHSYSGIGQAAVRKRTGLKKRAMLLPAQVAQCRKVRLFLRRSTADNWWREQVGGMKSHDIDSVNAALASIHPYTDHPEMRKVAYGAKAKSIEEQYAKYVPREFVPDCYKLPLAGHTGMAKETWCQQDISEVMLGKKVRTLHDSSREAAENSEKNTPVASAGAAADKPCLKRARWSSGAHKRLFVQALLDALFFGKLSETLAEWASVTAKMPAPKAGEQWAVSTIRRHAMSLISERADIHS